MDEADLILSFGYGIGIGPRFCFEHSAILDVSNTLSYWAIRYVVCFSSSFKRWCSIYNWPSRSVQVFFCIYLTSLNIHLMVWHESQKCRCLQFVWLREKNLNMKTAKMRRESKLAKFIILNFRVLIYIEFFFRAGNPVGAEKSSVYVM
jgi:hypothetical protein